MKYLIITILTLTIFLTGCKKQEIVVNNNIVQKDVIEKNIKSSTSTQIEDIEESTNIDGIYKDWKTYRNDEYWFEISYPTDWNAYSVDEVGIWKPKKNQVINIVPKDTPKNYAAIQVAVLEKKEIELKKYEFILSLKQVNKTNDVLFFYKTDNVLFSEYYILSDNYIYQFDLLDGFVNYSKGDEMMRKIVYSFELLND